MAIDLAKIAREQEFELETTALGRIRCGTYSINAAIEIEKIIDNEDLTGPAFARALLQTIGRMPPDHETTDEEDKTAAQLTQEQVDAVTDDELEVFSRAFLARNRYLLKPGSTAEEGEPSEQSAETASLEKLTDESDCDFLLRVVKEYNKVQATRMGKFLEPFASLAKPLFSNSTVDLLRKNLMLSDRLKDSLAGVQQATNLVRDQPLLRPEPPRMPDLRPPENPTYETNRRLNTMLDYADRVEPLVVESGELIRNLNEAAIQMLADFGRSTRRAETFNKIIISIAALSLFVTAVFSVWSFFDARKRSEGTTAMLAAQSVQTTSLVESQDSRVTSLLRAFQREAEDRSEEQRRAFTALIDSLRADAARADETRKQEQRELEGLLNALSTAVTTMNGQDQAAPDTSGN